jgi:hypothetical protein
VLVTGALDTDRRGIDDAEAGFVDGQPDVPDKAFSAFEQRYYRYHRERHGYGMDLGFQPDADNSWFARYYEMGYSETVLRLYFNAKNLTNTPLKITEGSGENRLVQREFYAVTLQAGFNYKL